MNRQMRFRMIKVALAWSLTVSAVPATAFADGGAVAPNVSVQQTVENESLGSVNLTGGSSMEIKQASILASDEGKVASFTITVHNDTNYEIQFIDYWVRLLNKTGTFFTVHVLPSDKNRNQIAPHSSLDINMYAKVSADTDLNDLIFRIIQWDFRAPNYERQLGEIAVPAEYTNITPADHSRIVQIGGSQVRMGASKLEVGQNADYYLPKVRLQLENVGLKAVELPVYQFALRTKEGLLYPLTAKGLEENNRSLYPRFNKELELSGKLPLSVGSEDWQLVITSQLDANTTTNSATKLSLPVAFFALPTARGVGDGFATPLDGSKTLEVGTGSLETKVKNINRTKREESYAVSIGMTLKNTGTSSITVPVYRFAIQTAEGLVYPAKTESLKDMIIDPLFQKDIQLTATIPSSVNPTDWKLLLLPAAEANGTPSNIELASYVLSNDSRDLGGMGQAYSFSNKNGIYTATLNAIQRLPWEDQDILSASLSISTKGASSLPLPEFTGYFLLDDTVKIPASALVKDNVISVKQDGPVNLQLYGKIPYTNEYTNIKLVLQEKSGESKVEDLLDFRADSKVASLPNIPSQGSFNLDGVGQRANISVRSTQTFWGDESDIFTVQLKVENLERRYTKTNNFVGYLQNEEDGTVYPVTIPEIKNKVVPNGLALLNATANVPRMTPTSKLKLILGTGVKEGKLTQESKPDAYVSGVLFDLPSENMVVQKDMKFIDLYPYVFSINKLSKSIEENFFKFDLKYKLVKNRLVESNQDGHLMVMEVEDRDKKVVASTSYALDSSSSDQKNNIKLGEGELVFKSPTYENINTVVNYFGGYKLKIYHEYNGQRKLLAEQEVNSFPVEKE